MRDAILLMRDAVLFMRNGIFRVLTVTVLHTISLTCGLCKVLEHIVASNLTKHLANSNILFELQHGFREKRSCETQLVMLVDEIAKTCRRGNKLI